MIHQIRNAKKVAWGILALLAVSLSPAMGEYPEIIPESYPRSRYEELWERKLFALETPVTTSSTSFAKDWHLVGVTNFGGVKAVLLSNHKTKQLIRLTSDQGSDGFELVSVSESQNTSEVVATIRNGNELAKVGYDPVQLAKGPSSPAPAEVRDEKGSTWKGRMLNEEQESSRSTSANQTSSENPAPEASKEAVSKATEDRKSRRRDVMLPGSLKQN